MGTPRGPKKCHTRGHRYYALAFVLNKLMFNYEES